MKKTKVFVVGTHGVPAKYGGFETLADFLCQNLSDDFDITVYCSSKKYKEKRQTYANSKLIYINLGASGVSGIIYDVLTFSHALFKADVILYLSPVGSGFITPIGKLFKTKVIVNHGGLNEWEREKLSWFQKKWAKFNHRVASKFSTLNIVDNELYNLSLKQNFNAESQVIRYGGDHVKVVGPSKYLKKYPFVIERYAVSVSRAQIDNNLHIILECFEDFQDYKLVLISNWDVSKYGIDLKEKYSNRENIILLDAIYNLDELDYLRGNSYVYIHSHSRCGTAPSLVEAMCLGKAVVSFDVPTNRETTKNSAIYFKNSTDLKNRLNSLNESVVNTISSNLAKIATVEYSWKTISSQYSKLIKSFTK